VLKNEVQTKASGKEEKNTDEQNNMMPATNEGEKRFKSHHLFIMFMDLSLLKSRRYGISSSKIHHV